jgi:hypothetical protein
VIVPSLLSRNIELDPRLLPKPRGLCFWPWGHFVCEATWRSTIYDDESIYGCWYPPFCNLSHVLAYVSNKRMHDIDEVPTLCANRENGTLEDICKSRTERTLKDRWKSHRGDIRRTRLIIRVSCENRTSEDVYK